MPITYTYNTVTLPYVATVAAPFSTRIGSSETPGRSGGYAGAQYAAERKISLTGTLTGATYTVLHDNWSNLVAAHDVSGPQPLSIRTGWYFNATVESFADSEREIDHIQWDATYVCADPYQYSTTLSAPTLATTGGTITGVLGNKNALPVLTLTVSAAPANAYVTVSNTTTGESFTLFPDATGAYIIDSLLETVTRSSVDKMATFQGRFVSLKPGSNVFTITVTNGATLSAVTINYRARAL